MKNDYTELDLVVLVTNMSAGVENVKQNIQKLEDNVEKIYNKIERMHTTYITKEEFERRLSEFKDSNGVASKTAVWILGIITTIVGILLSINLLIK